MESMVSTIDWEHCQSEAVVSLYRTYHCLFTNEDCSVFSFVTVPFQTTSIQHSQETDSNPPQPSVAKKETKFLNSANFARKNTNRDH